jgi:nicotinamide-nucleotide amidase
MDLKTLAQEIGQTLTQRELSLTTAESCTGGWTAQVVTAVPGSSPWFERGFITYSNLAKQELLGVPAATLTEHGAVSEATARAMAEGALQHSRAQVALAITGVAGPDGGSPEKPVGTVWLAWAGAGRSTLAELHRFAGDREQVRRQAVEAALRGLLRFLGA